MSRAQAAAAEWAALTEGESSKQEPQLLTADAVRARLRSEARPSTEAQLTAEAQLSTEAQLSAKADDNLPVAHYVAPVDDDLV